MALIKVRRGKSQARQLLLWLEVIFNAFMWKGHSSLFSFDSKSQQNELGIDLLYIGTFLAKIAT